MALKVIDQKNLPHLVEMIRSLIPKRATREADGLMPALSGNDGQVLLGTGEWGEYRGGGGSGPISLEVDAEGNLYAYYDDNYGPPSFEYEDSTGALYWKYETEV